MQPLIRKFKIILKALSFATLALVALIFIRRLPVTESLQALLELNDRFFYKIFFKMRANHEALLEASKEILVIDSVDPKEEIGCEKYAEIITKLARDSVACIGLDIRFPGNKEDTPEAKARLVEAIRQFDRVVLGVSFSAQDPQEVFGPDPAALEFLKQFALPEATAKYFSQGLVAASAELPFDALLFAANHLGHINFAPERYHAFPLVMKHELQCYAAMPFELARLYRERQGFNLDITRVPLTTHSQMFVNFVPCDRFDYKTLQDADSLLSDPENRARFNVKDKIILLVNSSAEVPFPDTPLGPVAYPRWGLHASIVSQLLQNRPIYSSLPTSMVFVAAVLLLALAWNLFFAERFAKRWLRIRWMIVIGNAVLVALAYFGLQVENWFSVIIPVIVYSTGLLAIRNDIYYIYEIPEYEDFSVSVQEFQGDGYPVSIVYSPAGEELEKVFFTKFFTGSTFAAIEEKLRHLSAGLHETRALGKQLYGAIFQKSIDTRLMQSLGFISRSSKSLRVRLRLDAPEISRLPWEYMYSEAQPDEFLALNRNISLTRYIPLADNQEWAAFRPPLRILMVIASPANLPPLDVEAEKASIKKCLGALLWFYQVRLTFCEHATLEKLGEAIVGGKHHVLHYIGHSDFDETKGEGVLLLEDENGEAQAVEAAAIGSILDKSSIRLAILNSCKGAAAPNTSPFFGVAQKLVKVGVPAVIAMQHLIRDDIAVVFAKTFYSTFLSSFSVDMAVTEARRAIMRHTGGLNRQDWGTPVLFMRADGAKIFSAR